MPKEIIEDSSNSELTWELMRVLEKEASLFETFLDLLEQQQEALVRNDVNRLNEITERQKEKLVSAGQLSKNREELIRRLSEQGKASENLTISRLIESASSGQATMMEQLRETILELNEKIMKVRSQNEMLINRSRENIMKTIELLGRIKMPDDQYHSEGKRNVVQGSLALDRRV
jgi:predicted transcriptional regulator